jgi:hypothetical protein
MTTKFLADFEESLYRMIEILSAPDDYSTKTSKNILNSFNHLP